MRAVDAYYCRGDGTSETTGGAEADRRPRSPSGAVPVDGDFHGVVGRSPAMRQVFEQTARVAAGNAPVLIVGETGTGKELVARALHESGPRRRGPYLVVNCAALPRELIESELFGYARGAFSGAITDHPGLFRAAGGGTVLLDEITEMSPELQAKLLRVVQERAVRPVGSIAEVPVDVRFIASSNRDAEGAVRCGLLRADLYYRLSVSVIAVPPLRARGDDVLLLVEHCLDTLNQRYGETLGEMRGIEANAIAALVSHSWPGNVRELFNVLERAFIASPSLRIRESDLGMLPLASEPAMHAPDLARGARAATCAESECALIAHALEFTGGNKARAARQLGISRKRLYARIAKYAL